MIQIRSYTNSVFAGSLYAALRDEMRVYVKRLSVATFLPVVCAYDIIFKTEEYNWQLGGLHLLDVYLLQ